MRFGSRQDGVGVAETLLTVSPGCSNFTSVLNVANQPIQFAKGTVIGHIEERTPDTTVETLATRKLNRRQPVLTQHKVLQVPIAAASKLQPSKHHAPALTQSHLQCTTPCEPQCQTSRYSHCS